MNHYAGIDALLEYSSAFVVDASGKTSRSQSSLAFLAQRP